MMCAQAATVLRALSDPTRLRLLRALVAAKGKELCNCELVDSLHEPQPNVSRHLRMLAQAGVLQERREGRWVYYGLNPNEPIMAALHSVVGTLEDARSDDDATRLRERLRLRQGGKCVLGIQNTHLLSQPSLQKARASRRRKEVHR